MSYNTTENTSDESYDQDYEEVLTPSPQIQFWTYLIFDIPALLCNTYVLYHLIFDQNLRKRLHNHVIIILLILCFVLLAIDNSLYLNGWYNFYNHSFEFSPILCLLWWFMDYGFYGAISIFLVWASLERHILVFYRRQLLRTQSQIFLLHYMPLIVIMIYLVGFYVGVIFFPPCENIFYGSDLACGSSPCYQEIEWLNTWDYFFNGVLCNLLEAFLTCTFLVRIIWRRFIATRNFNWKKYRTMSIQLLSISALSLSINLPQSLIMLVRTIRTDMSDFGINIEPYLFYLTGYVIIFIPIICLGCSPDLWSKRYSCLRLRRSRIVPMVASVGIPTMAATIRSRYA